MNWFVIPYAYGLDREKRGLPDAESRGRCDVALEEATKLPNAVVVLSAGMADSTRKFESPHLAAASQKYLLSQGWSGEKILTNPKGKDTVTETEAAMELIGNSPVVATTTWYHAFRVWLVWLIYGKLVRLRVSWHMASRFSIIREMLAIPKSLVQAIWRKALKS